MLVSLYRCRPDRGIILHTACTYSAEHRQVTEQLLPVSVYWEGHVCWFAPLGPVYPVGAPTRSGRPLDREPVPLSPELQPVKSEIDVAASDLNKQTQQFFNDARDRREQAAHA